MTSAEDVQSRLSVRMATCSYYSLYYRNLLKAFIKNVNPIYPATFIDSIRMIRLILKVRRYTAVFIPRLVSLYKLSKEIDRLKIPGDVVECGVYNGGSSALMASVCIHPENGRDMWLFDSFEGLPKPTKKDGEKAQSCGWWCHGDLERVERIFKKLYIPESRVHIIKGWFHETFPSAQLSDVALLHIDADWYESVKLCFENFYQCVRPGGFIVIDDYGHWEGCRQATDEFLESRAINAELIEVDYTGRYFQKPL